MVPQVGFRGYPYKIKRCSGIQLCELKLGDPLKMKKTLYPILVGEPLCILATKTLNHELIVLSLDIRYWTMYLGIENGNQAPIRSIWRVRHLSR